MNTSTYGQVTDRKPAADGNNEMMRPEISVIKTVFYAVIENKLTNRQMLGEPDYVSQQVYTNKILIVDNNVVEMDL